MFIRSTIVSGAALVACANVFAQGTVQIYGVLDTFAGQIKNTTATGSVTTNVVNSGGLTTSFWGVRGTEDLGGGYKAVFALESFVRVDTGATGRNDTDPLFARAAFVGIDSPYGQLTMGRMPTPYALATTNFTPFVGATGISPIFANAFKNNVLGDTRMNNSIKYQSPRMNGFEADLQHSLGQEEPSGVNYKRDVATDGALRYSNQQLALVVATRQINLNTANDGHKQGVWMVGGSYDFGVAKLTAQYHKVRETYQNSALNADRKVTELGVAVPVGSGAILAEYATMRANDRVATTIDRRKSFAFGYDYNLSKRTDLYAMYYADKLYSPDSKQATTAFGIRHRF
ncbi:porin [Polaromonas jejuensis]|uniref:Porin n=1 Tax=Polaromonas jejuensis TaxID=457502 RepID=A0ABW0Q7F7_9BURK|nr:porin [Polaromonas jejuensis]